MFEVKWDGYRALAYVRGGEAKLVSRNGNDLTGRFPQVAKEVVGENAVAPVRRERKAMRQKKDIHALLERKAPDGARVRLIGEESIFSDLPSRGRAR